MKKWNFVGKRKKDERYTEEKERKKESVQVGKKGWKQIIVEKK